MTRVELVADSDVVSYIYGRGPLGEAYSDLIGERRTGITLLAVAEARVGVTYGNWGDRKIASLHAFLGRFFVLEPNAEIANVCGGLLGRCKQIGVAMSWPDTWAAATALWLDVPLATHDRDLERVPGLRVLTVHEQWQVREKGSGIGAGDPLWLGEGSFGCRQAGVCCQSYRRRSAAQESRARDAGRDVRMARSEENASAP